MPAILRVQRHVLLPVLLVAALLGSLVGLAPHAEAATSRTQRVDTALKVAEDQKGAPYVWGAEGPNAFDCSGLVYYSYHVAGFANVPRTAAEQAQAVRRIDRNSMRPGDLVFFYSGSHVYHVGVYVGRAHGERMIVHAPHPGASVRLEAIWTNAWFPGTLR